MNDNEELLADIEQGQDEEEEESEKDDDGQFSAIEEEEDEEDSFERATRTLKENKVKEIEEKLQEMEIRMASSMHEKPSKKTTMGYIMDDFGFDEDDDLLQNFEGIPRFSIIDLLERHRESMSIKPNNFQHSTKVGNQATEVLPRKKDSIKGRESS